MGALFLDPPVADPASLALVTCPYTAVLCAECEPPQCDECGPVCEKAREAIERLSWEGD